MNPSRKATVVLYGVAGVMAAPWVAEYLFGRLRRVFSFRHITIERIHP